MAHKHLTTVPKGNSEFCFPETLGDLRDGIYLPVFSLKHLILLNQLNGGNCSTGQSGPPPEVDQNIRVGMNRKEPFYLNSNGDILNYFKMKSILEHE